MVDGNYSLNFNHPASDVNQIRNFDTRANQFSLNQMKFTFEREADPVGFRVDVGFGKAFDIMHSTEQAPEATDYIEQAYLRLKPKAAKGFQVDFGKFVTSAGAEVIESKDNWNYSRSLLFALAIPYYHFGVRTSMPIGSHFTGGVQVVQGWNNVKDNNSGKTLGFTGNVTAGKVTWSNTVYTGPENAHTNEGWRTVYDTVVLVNANDKTSFYLNYDYGRNAYPGGGASEWTGIAGAARYQITKTFAFAPRAEWFYDKNGFSTGTVQKLKEVTLTAEAKLMDGLISRLEYRQDWSDQPFFDRGNDPGSHKNQPTLLLGLIAYWGPKR